MIVPFEQDNYGIINGILREQDHNTTVPIINGVPRFVPLDYLVCDQDFQMFISQYKNQLQNTIEFSNVTSRKLSKKTAHTFGFEWDYYGDWGWIDDKAVSEEDKKYKLRGGLLSNTKSAFITKCKIYEESLNKNALILDAGCGNGRYTHMASLNGAIVIGVDLGHGVKAAYRHMKTLPNVHLAQADLFNLPFKKNLFDVIFSTGVLVHTGNAKKAFNSVSQHSKSGGIFVAHLCHKRNPIFEIINRTLRFFTTKLSIKYNLLFARFMAKQGKKLMEKGTWSKWFKYIEILPTEHHMFDWYSSPYLSHHTYPEVKKWFEDANFEIIETNEHKTHNITVWNKPESLTIKGKKLSLQK